MSHLMLEPKVVASHRIACPLVASGDGLPIWPLTALLQGGAGGCGDHLLLVVQGDVAQLPLDVTHDVPLGSGGEAVTTQQHGVLLGGHTQRIAEGVVPDLFCVVLHGVLQGQDAPFALGLVAV